MSLKNKTTKSVAHEVDVEIVRFVKAYDLLVEIIDELMKCDYIRTAGDDYDEVYESLWDDLRNPILNLIEKHMGETK